MHLKDPPHAKLRSLPSPPPPSSAALPLPSSAHLSSYPGLLLFLPLFYSCICSVPKPRWFGLLYIYLVSLLCPAVTSNCCGPFSYPPSTFHTVTGTIFLPMQILSGHPARFDRKQQNSVKQLSFNLKIN